MPDCIYVTLLLKITSQDHNNHLVVHILRQHICFFSAFPGLVF